MPIGPRPPLAIGQGRVSIEGTFSGQRWANVFHVEVSAPGTQLQTDWDDILAGIKVAYDARFKSLLSTACSIDKVEGTLRTGAVTGLQGELVNAISGTNAGAVLPASSSTCISWRVGLFYRGGHPRTYLCGHTATQMGTVAKWSATHATNAAAAATLFRADVNALIGAGGTTTQLGMLSYVLAGAWRAAPVFFPYLGATCDLRIDTQRRRLGPDQ